MFYSGQAGLGAKYPAYAKPRTLAASGDNLKLMKILATILLTILTMLTFAQKVFKVDNFSKDYYGKIQISDTSEVFTKGWVAIYDRKTNKQLIKVTSDELALELHDGKAVANIKELPYGEQSLIMYDDFNFDGKKDFAVCDGQNSCYHGPSFKIYLAANNGFLYNKDFTRLAQEYCGMFNVDSEAKKIYTMTKSGCCWHEFSEFIVVNNKPKPIKIETEEQDMPFNITTQEIWNGKSMVKKSIKTIDTDQEGIEVILSFKIPQNDKEIILYNINDRTLNYALVKKDSTVEFSYPIETVYQNPDFEFDSTTNNLAVTFKNKTAHYQVYDRPNEIGITINSDGKTYNWVGDLNTKKGSLDRLRTVKLDNVY